MPRRISAIQLEEAAPDEIEAHLHDVLDVSASGEHPRASTEAS